ncbi:MAG: serine hydrolase [Nitrospirae bacterium]|nr:serine hydrolase [Nitrospirota bacterium]
MFKHKYLRFLIYLAVASLLFVAGWYSHIWSQSLKLCYKPRRVSAKGFYFTSPLLDVELPEGVVINQEPIPFKHKVESLIHNRSKEVQEVSVYYRDLHDGPWFGINEDREFNPASMMKVPLMIAWLKRAETDRLALNRTMRYDGTIDISALQQIRPAYTITPGRSYTVEELLQYMISYSDNNATALLYNALNNEEIGAVLDGMDVNNTVIGGSNFISVHGYSGFFRILYNASYLNREMSEKALALMSQQDFSQGIAAGLPAGVAVASKFGESVQRGGERQLHEFGIVYHPTRPYILGIMTLGNNLEKQAEFLRDISRLIYREVDSSDQGPFKSCLQRQS